MTDGRKPYARSGESGDELFADQTDHLEICVVEMLEEDTLDARALVLLQSGYDLIDRADKLVLLAE